MVSQVSAKDILFAVLSGAVLLVSVYLRWKNHTGGRQQQKTDKNSPTPQMEQHSKVETARKAKDKQPKQRRKNKAISNWKSQETPIRCFLFRVFSPIAIPYGLVPPSKQGGQSHWERLGNSQRGWSVTHGRGRDHRPRWLFSFRVQFCCPGVLWYRRK